MAATDIDAKAIEYAEACYCVDEAMEYANHALVNSSMRGQALRTAHASIAGPAHESIAFALRAIQYAGEAAQCVMAGQYGPPIKQMALDALTCSKKAQYAHQRAIDASVALGIGTKGGNDGDGRRR